MAQVNYQPWAMMSLTHVFANHNFALATPAAYSIRVFDAFEVTQSQPFTHELPHAIMDIIAADPTSSIAVKYRNYVKTVLLPLCRRVTGILRAHSAVIEVCRHSRISSFAAVCLLPLSPHTTVAPTSVAITRVAR